LSCSKNTEKGLGGPAWYLL